MAVLPILLLWTCIYYPGVFGIEKCTNRVYFNDANSTTSEIFCPQNLAFDRKMQICRNPTEIPTCRRAFIGVIRTLVDVNDLDKVIDVWHVGEVEGAVTANVDSNNNHVRRKRDMLVKAKIMEAKDQEEEPEEKVPDFSEAMEQLKKELTGFVEKKLSKPKPNNPAALRSTESPPPEPVKYYYGVNAPEYVAVADLSFMPWQYWLSLGLAFLLTFLIGCYCGYFCKSKKVSSEKRLRQEKSSRTSSQTQTPMNQSMNQQPMVIHPPPPPPIQLIQSAPHSPPIQLIQQGRQSKPQVSKAPPMVTQIPIQTHVSSEQPVPMLPRFPAPICATITDDQGVHEYPTLTRTTPVTGGFMSEEYPMMVDSPTPPASGYSTMSSSIPLRIKNRQQGIKNGQSSTVFPEKSSSPKSENGAWFRG